MRSSSLAGRLAALDRQIDDEDRARRRGRRRPSSAELATACSTRSTPTCVEAEIGERGTAVGDA